ncbi:YcjX family GTP-binding protein [Thalassotalea hakodatensis]|uniref:YcjX family protein n=1 Tax=Thalassotalea hakodatensis TaxID=3030492 RepID=UPI002574085A|nr:YcjX family protein [Thalassotalea hakodatensis]
MPLIEKELIEKIRVKANVLKHRAIDQHINLAVTGLSRSGKTAFITSLVNQLINENAQSQMTFFSTMQEGRFIAAKRVPQKNLHIARFDYDSAAQALSEEPPHWPAPTKGISQLRIAIKYQPKDSFIKYTTNAATLFVDITDYPGEWLLDLPMLNQTYEEWSQATTELLLQSPRADEAASFLNRIESISPFEPVDEKLLEDISKQYTELLNKFRHEMGLSLIQPGRFILPGDLAGAPILQFFPYTQFKHIDLDHYQKAQDDTLIGMLRARYIEYKERVVKEFYKEHFVNFDRQIILADCLTPLNNGHSSFKDLQQAITLITESFRYGSTNFISRLFSPKIDKLLFAATKSDHVTPEQHGNLTSLLAQLVHPVRQKTNFDNINTETLAISSVKATQFGKSQHQGKQIPVVRGNQLSDFQEITLYPGMVPKELPAKSYWQDYQFKFVPFAPLVSTGLHQPFQHIRMDQVLEFLLGDKMK